MIPIISVILPIHNAEKTLKETLDSLICQTYKNFEIIAIDDGSKDSSLSILNKYSKQEPRLRIISRTNKGLPHTLNEGIGLARGKYIARMDADDICLPIRFEKQIAFLEKNNLDLCGTQIQEFGLNSRKSSLPITEEGCIIKSLFSCSFIHPTIFGKKSVFLKYKYNEDFDCSQDYNLWCRMLANNIRINNMPEILLKYRIASNTITSIKSQKQRTLSIKTATNYWKELALTQVYNLPNFMRSYDFEESEQIIDCLQILDDLQLKVKNNESKELINVQKYHLLMNTTKIDINKMLSILKKEKKQLTLRQITTILFIYIFKLTKLKNRIKSHQNLTRSLCNILKY